ncbi:GNAT family N-acetyltransferase [Streptomyces capparidis]
MEPVTLTTERLLLRPFTPQDAPAVLAACQDPEIQRWTRVPSPYTREHAEGFVGDLSPRGWREGTLFNFGSFTLDTGELVSSVGLVRLDLLNTEERMAEIGYWTAGEQRGRGYTAEAVRAVARWAFTVLGVERLEWLAEVGNTASRHVAEAAGFVVEGTLRSRLAHSGTRRDAWVGALLPSDVGLAPGAPYLPHA